MADKQKLPEETLKELRAVERNLEALTPDEREAFEDVKKELAQSYEIPEYTKMDKALDYAKKGLGYGMSALDYPAGLTRMSVAKILGGQVKPEDWEKASAGQAPGLGEIMARSGYKGGGAQAAGLLGDLLLDPINLVSFGGGGALKTAIAPLSAGLKYGGKKLYGSAFKDLDWLAKQKGKPPVSELLWDKVGATSAQNLAEKSLEEMGKLEAKRAGLYAEGGRLGAKVRPQQAMGLAKQEIRGAGLRMRPEVRKAVTPIIESVVEHSKLPNMTLEQASRVKSDLYDPLRETAYDIATRSGAGEQFTKKQAQGYKEAIESSAEAAKPGLGKDIADVNEELGRWLDIGKAVQKKAKKEATRDALTKSDVTSGLISYALDSPEYFAAKKLFEAGITPGGRTYLGRGLYKLGQSGLADSAVRRLPWSLLKEEE